MHLSPESSNEWLRILQFASSTPILTIKKHLEEFFGLNLWSEDFIKSKLPKIIQGPKFLKQGKLTSSTESLWNVSQTIWWFRPMN